MIKKAKGKRGNMLDDGAMHEEQHFWRVELSLEHAKTEWEVRAPEQHLLVAINSHASFFYDNNGQILTPDHPHMPEDGITVNQLENPPQSLLFHKLASEPGYLVVLRSCVMLEPLELPVRNKVAAFRYIHNK